MKIILNATLLTLILISYRGFASCKEGFQSDPIDRSDENSLNGSQSADSSKNLANDEVKNNCHLDPKKSHNPDIDRTTDRGSVSSSFDAVDYHSGGSGFSSYDLH